MTAATEWQRTTEQREERREKKKEEDANHLQMTLRPSNIALSLSLTVHLRGKTQNMADFDNMKATQ